MPIDAGGGYLDRLGEEATFRGARDLVRFLAESPECHSAFIEQMFHYMVKQPVRAFGPNRMEALRDHFARHDLSIRLLLREIAVASAVNMRRRVLTPADRLRPLTDTLDTASAESTAGPAANSPE